MKLIKQVETCFYTISIYHHEDGMYSMEYDINGVTSVPQESEQYEMISALFDYKLDQLNNVQVSYISQ